MTTTGSKTVMVSYTENGITKDATYTINIIAVVATSIELTGTYPIEFEQGDEFSTSGMTIVEHFNNGTSQNHLPSSCTFTGYDMDAVGQQTVTVTYGSQTTTYTITVKTSGMIIQQKSVDLSIETYAEAHSWEDGKQYSTIEANSDITITAVKSGGSSDNTGKYYTNGNNWRLYQTETPELTIAAPDNGKIKAVTITYSVDNAGVLTCGGKNVNSEEEVTFNSKSATFGVGNTGTASNGQVRITNIDVDYELAVDPETKTITSLELSGEYQTSFTTGDEFVFGGTVTAVYADETTEDVTNGASFSGYDLSTSGTQTVTVTYNEKTTSYQITVSEPVSHKFYKVSGDLISGDYLLGYKTEFANAVISNININ